MCQSLLFDKVVSLRPATLLKKGLWYKCFPVIFAKSLKEHLFYGIPLDDFFRNSAVIIHKS